MRVILASKSPRRREIFGEYARACGFEFEIITCEVSEELNGEAPSSGVATLAKRKGEAVAAENRDALVISSDTLVELDGAPLGKPCDEEQARDMLRRLSGRYHNVHTGIALSVDGRVYSGVATTRVLFKPLSDAQIDDYIATGEPMDKAGAYGIQGLGGKFVESYDGEFDTVVGFNMTLLKELLLDAGVSL